MKQNDSVLEFVTHAIKENRARLAEHAAKGKVSSWEDYRHLVGQIYSMDEVLRTITETQKLVEESDE